jgi:hypothetical protein
MVLFWWAALHIDIMSEWLRRWIRNQVGFAHQLRDKGEAHPVERNTTLIRHRLKQKLVQRLGT